MKTLDQDGRAALRRYGVRFGFYHVFVPALLKPAPAGLLTLLWALSNDGKDKDGYGEIITLLASGRTSLVTDPSFDKEFYKLSGYRLLGPRAVRVDILERLADLIRPTVYWKPGTELPEGAYGDGRFVITPAMLSILGATAEDMEEVLKGLGYRHEPIDALTANQALEALKTQHGPKPAETAAEEPKAAEPASQTDDAAPEPKAEPQAEPEEAPKPVLVWRQARFERAPNRAKPGEQRKGAKPSGDQKPRRKGKPGGKNSQPQNAKASPPRKEKPIDPDSPFAKLQALKQQLSK